MRQVVIQRPNGAAQATGLRVISPWVVDVEFTGNATGIGFMGTPAPVAMTIQNFKVQLDTPAGGTPWPFTWYKNGAPTVLTATVSGTDPIATNNTDLFSLDPFDQFCLVWNAADMVNNFTYAFEIETLSDTTSVYGGPGPSTPDWGAFGTGHGDGEGSIAGSPGAITGIMGITDVAPGVGFHDRFYVMLNGVVQDGSGGTVDTQLFITDLATQAQNSFTLPIVPLDQVYVKADTTTPNGDPGRHLRQSITFDATQAGHFHTCGFRRNPVSGAEVYAWHSHSSATESQGVGIVPKSGLTLTGLAVVGDSGKNYKLRYNSGDPTNQPSVTIPGIGPNHGLDSNPLHSVTAFEGDLFDVATNQNGPDNYYWGFDSFITPAQAPVGTFTTTEHLIRRVRRAPHQAALGQRLYINRFTLDLQPGVGAVVGQGQDPQVLLRWSRNGGSTWTQWVSMSAGKLGEYYKRVYMTRIGQARDWVFEISVSDPVAWQIMAAILDAEPGSN